MSVERQASLPDYLAPGLTIVFVGINPGLYSAKRGHYFARLSNRFWPAFSRSRLSEPIRSSLGREALAPADDAALLRFGIGFTDVVKRPTRNAGELSLDEFKLSAPRLVELLARYQPRVACFHGLSGYRPFARFGLGETEPVRDLGPQRPRLGKTHLYVVPSPSPANAHFRLADQIAWYDRLAEYCATLAR